MAIVYDPSKIPQGMTYDAVVRLTRVTSFFNEILFCNYRIDRTNCLIRLSVSFS